MRLPAAQRYSQRPSTAGEFIVENLRSEILTGQLKARQPLLLDQLAARFGTSVIPIREALRVLEAERLVVLRPHKTAHVADLSLAELKDLYRVRLILDVEAVRLAHANLTADDFAEMRKLIDAMERHAVKGDDLAAFSVHGKIHFKIYEAADSPALLGILEGLWDETERYRHAVKHYRSDAHSWAEEHRRLVSLLGKKTPEPAAREMYAHLTRTLNALLEARTFETDHADAGDVLPAPRRSVRRKSA
jgi:DNA-binding GntR family transcriptional regulator